MIGKVYCETSRLILREMLPSDDDGMFELDSDPEVHRYLGNNPVTTLQQSRDVIALVRQQYVDNGIGRWSVIEKETGAFIGWSGLKLVKDTKNGQSNYYDIGYRLCRRFWGMGYASESAFASRDYAFDIMGVPKLIGTANVENLASCRILQKIGLQYVSDYDYNGIPCVWLEMQNPGNR